MVDVTLYDNDKFYLDKRKHADGEDGDHYLKNVPFKTLTKPRHMFEKLESDGVHAFEPNGNNEQDGEILSRRLRYGKSRRMASGSHKTMSDVDLLRLANKTFFEKRNIFSPQGIHLSAEELYSRDNTRKQEAKLREQELFLNKNKIERLSSQLRGNQTKEVLQDNSLSDYIKKFGEEAIRNYFKDHPEILRAIDMLKNAQKTNDPRHMTTNPMPTPMPTPTPAPTTKPKEPPLHDGL